MSNSVIDRRAGTAREGRDKLMMLVATLSRMSLGMLNFVVIARFLGPVKFGAIATAMAYATFVSLATDYGLNTSALRKASIDMESAGRIVGDALALKLLLILAVFPVAIFVATVTIKVELVPIYACIFAGTLAYSMADLSMVVARANRRFDVEAGLVVSTSLVMLAAVGGVAAWSRDLLLTSIAFLVTRVIYLIAAQIRLRPWLGPVRRMRRSFSQMGFTLRESASYAVDNVMTVLSGQIDVLIFAWVLTSYQMGVYQAGARLVQVIVPFAVVLSTVYMPALAAASVARDEDDQFRRLSRKVTLEFCGLAIVGGLGFAAVGPVFTTHFYGAKYQDLGPLWNGFAVYAMTRFAAAGFGIQLVALNKIRPRIISQVLAMIIFAILSAILLPKYRLGAASWLLAVVGLVNLAILGSSLANSPGRDKSVVIALIVLPVSAILAFIGSWSF